MAIDRRTFLKVSAGTTAFFFATDSVFAAAGAPALPPLISPGAIRSKVKIGLVYLGQPNALWPTPTMDADAEVRDYEREFAANPAYDDIDFVGRKLVSKPEEFEALTADFAAVDGLLLIHVSMGITELLASALKVGKPTMFFAKPYSGHEWVSLGRHMTAPEGELLDCILSGDLAALETAVRPFRAIHHMREAKILNVTSHALPADYCAQMKDRFGTEIIQVSKEDVLGAYEAVDAAAVTDEAARVVQAAQKVVEPNDDEIARSCRLALAFEHLLAQHEATAITVDCYGSMYRQLPAFPCFGFTRLNDMGLAGICESDLKSAMTFILMQALSGKPGFISDPTVDESTGSIILAHCLGSTKMNGLEGEACPYRIRTIMERQEGAVMQVFMPVGPKVTQGILVGADKLIYFTGDVIEAPDTERGCRTKITVKVDGDVQTLWRNWSNGLHRVTCYGDMTQDLQRFCRFKKIAMADEARSVVA